MREIKLSQGKVALVDDEDFEWLSQWKWFYHSQGYAVKNFNNSQVLLHRDIMKPSKGFIVDHINRDRLDCRRSNMRLCTYADNNKNSRARNNKIISQYKGVRLKPENKFRPWAAEIHAPSGRLYLGSYHTEKEAAIAYNFAALRHFGEYSRYNEVA